MPATERPLHPKLKQAQHALEEALDEACETDVAHADGADLMRLEESLVAAREAARKAIAVLQSVHGENEQAGEPEPEPHRVFVDDRGVQWDAFCVYPSPRSSGRKALPAPYDKGWLSIQCANEIRRVTPIPERWRELPRGDLCRLVEKGVVAPRRTDRSQSNSPRPGDQFSTPDS